MYQITMALAVKLFLFEFLGKPYNCLADLGRTELKKKKYPRSTGCFCGLWASRAQNVLNHAIYNAKAMPCT